MGGGAVVTTCVMFVQLTHLRCLRFRMQQEDKTFRNTGWQTRTRRGISAVAGFDITAGDPSSPCNVPKHLRFNKLDLVDGCKL